MVSELREAFGKVQTVDPCGPVYKGLCAILDKADKPALEACVAANIKFVSSLARNRLFRMQ